MWHFSPSNGIACACGPAIWQRSNTTYYSGYSFSFVFGALNWIEWWVCFVFRFFLFCIFFFMHSNFGIFFSGAFSIIRRRFSSKTRKLYTGTKILRNFVILLTLTHFLCAKKNNFFGRCTSFISHSKRFASEAERERDMKLIFSFVASIFASIKTPNKAK